MGNISSSNPKYTSASNSSSKSLNKNSNKSSNKNSNNSTNNSLSDSTNDDLSDSTNDGSSDSTDDGSSDSSNSSSSDISRDGVIKNKLQDEELKSLELYKRQYKRRLKQKYKRRFKQQYKQRYKSDNTNNDSSDRSNDSSNDSSKGNSSDISQYNVIKDKLKDEELCKPLELHKRRFKSDNTNNDSSDSSNESSSNSSTNSSRDISWYNAIKDKLDKLKDEELCKSLEEWELNNLILNLGDETRFLNQYLQLGDNHLNQITKDLQQYNFSIFSLGEKYVRDLINVLRENRRKSDKFNVYLFISKLQDNRSDSPFLRFLAKSLLRNKYGMFHVGLEIDGIILEWGTGDAGPHLIYPRVNTKRLYEKLAHIRVNYGQEFNLITTFSQTWYQNLYYIILNLMRKLLSYVPKIGIMSSNKLQIIAQKCVYWNKNFSYNPLRRNCQHFINEIFEALGLTFNPEGEFKKFLDRIVKYADDKFLFQEIEFLSRQDLDQFADQNWGMITNVWDKRLLLCYSEMMNSMFEHKRDDSEKWGPMNSKEKWVERENELRTD